MTVYKSGERVQFTGDVDYMPYTTVKKGETGIILNVLEPEEAVEVLLDTTHNGLHFWRNSVTLYLPDVGVSIRHIINPKGLDNDLGLRYLGTRAGGSYAGVNHANVDVEGGPPL